MLSQQVSVDRFFCGIGGSEPGAIVSAAKYPRVSLKTINGSWVSIIPLPSSNPEI